MGVTIDLSRDQVIRGIRRALRERSGKPWSVRGDRGTAWGWITITAPPKRRDEEGCLTAEDAAELGQLLGLGRASYRSGESVPASSRHYQEFVDRANGRSPSVFGEQYWD